MKKLIMTAFVAVGLAASADSYKITQNNVGDLSRDGAVFVIEDDVTLNGNVKLGYGSTVIFDGGTLSGNGTLDFNYSTIQAHPYTIFNGLEFEGSPMNATVEAVWFAPYGDDASTAVNAALKAAPTSVVNVGGAEYALAHHITLDVNGQRVRCTGTLYVTGAAAFEVSASNVGIEVHNVSGRGTGTAIKVDKSGSSHFKADLIKGFDRAIDLTAVGIVQYNKFDIGRVEAVTAVNFATSPANEITGNQFKIVSAKGDYGVKMGRPSGNDRRVSENIFSGTYFDSAKTALTVAGSRSDRFDNIKVADTTPVVLDIGDTEFTEVDIQGMYSLTKIRHADNIYNVYVKGSVAGQPTDVDMAVITSDDKGAGQSYIYLTSKTAPSNMLSTLRFDRGNNTITPADLMAQMKMYKDGEGPVKYDYYQRMISNLCTVKVTGGGVLTLDLTGEADGLNDPVTLVVDTAGGGVFKVRELSGKRKTTRTLGAGTYVVTADNGRPTIIEL